MQEAKCQNNLSDCKCLKHIKITDINLITDLYSLASVCTQTSEQLYDIPNFKAVFTSQKTYKQVHAFVYIHTYKSHYSQGSEQTFAAMDNLLINIKDADVYLYPLFMLLLILTI